MTATVAGIHLSGNHAGRPAANTVPDGSLYSCSTHSLIYQSNFAGNSWSTWATLGSVGGSVATDAIWDAAGDLAVGSGADTAARLAIGSTNGMVVSRVSGAVAWALPPGYEWDYAEITSPVTVSGTAETAAGSTSVVTGNAKTYDGAAVLLHFFSPAWAPLNNTAGNDLRLGLYEGSTFLGRLALTQQTVNGGGQDDYKPLDAFYRFTPSAASHTYNVRATRTGANGTIQAGAAGATNYVPAFMRITKV